MLNIIYYFVTTPVQWSSLVLFISAFPRRQRCPSLDFLLEPEPIFFDFVFLGEPEPELF